jgi:hypothetical protein
VVVGFYQKRDSIESGCGCPSREQVKLSPSETIPRMRRVSGTPTQAHPPSDSTEARHRGALGACVEVCPCTRLQPKASPADKAAPVDEPSFLADPTIQQRVEVLAS